MKIGDILKGRKKYAFTLLVIGLLIINSNSFSAGTVKVLTAEEYIEQTAKNQFLIPVFISGNDGIMGFRLEFIYDKNQLEIDYISKGNVTKTGSFDSTIDDSGEYGRGTAIWYHTENVTGNGSICYLGVTLKDGFSTGLIRVGYIQEDTFNESWQDVQLDCYNISFGNNQAENSNDTEETSKESGYSSKSTGEDNDGSSDKSNKKDNNNDVSKKDVSEIESSDLVEKDYNNNELSSVQTSPGVVILSQNLPSQNDSKSLSEIAETEEEKELKESAKKDGESKELTKNINSDEIKDYVIRELVSEGYDNLNQIPEDKKKEFWNNVKNCYFSDHKNESADYSSADFSVFKELVQISDAEIKEVRTSSKKQIIPIIVIIIIIIIVLTTVVVFIRKKKSK